VLSEQAKRNTFEATFSKILSTMLVFEATSANPIDGHGERSGASQSKGFRRTRLGKKQLSMHMTLWPRQWGNFKWLWERHG